jgi:hypothetical protein
MTKETPIARLKVVLDNVKPTVMRRLEVPVTIKLTRLHTMLQSAMGWTDSHLWEFYFRDVRFGVPDPDWDGDALDARKATLLDVIEDTGVKSFTYMYDFGDGWKHSIKIERIEPSIPGMDYPFLIDATGACPPEDCGGPWGYMEALEILADPKHERHQEIKEWWPLDHEFNLDSLTRSVDSLVRSRAKKPKSKAK